MVHTLPSKHGPGFANWQLNLQQVNAKKHSLPGTPSPPPPSQGVEFGLPCLYRPPPGSHSSDWPTIPSPQVAAIAPRTCRMPVHSKNAQAAMRMCLMISHLLDRAADERS